MSNTYISKLKSLLISIPLALALCLVAAFGGFSADCAELTGNTLRLHIIANSDSEADQRVKLQIRDRLFALFTELFADADGIETAERLAAESLVLFAETADEVLRQNGLPYTARALLTEAWFDTTDYGEYLLPAGKYKAIRVILGGGEGKNWFCVAFPPMCVYAACETDEKEIKKAAEENGWRVTKKGGKYIIRFKVYELLKKWFEQKQQL